MAQNSSSPVVGLSVAVGRFFEALFWAMMQVAGQLAGGIIAVIVALIVVARIFLRRWPWRRRG